MLQKNAIEIWLTACGSFTHEGSFNECHLQWRGQGRAGIVFWLVSRRKIGCKQFLVLDIHESVKINHFKRCSCYNRWSPSILKCIRVKERGSRIIKLHDLWTKVLMVKIHSSYTPHLWQMMYFVDRCWQLWPGRQTGKDSWRTWLQLWWLCHMYPWKASKLWAKGIQTAKKVLTL